MFQSRRGDPLLGSGRSMVLGRGGMVCASQPLASYAGAHVLREGGNAVDAAVAAAAVLGVVEPYSTGVGGDCFMLVWHAASARLYGLNGSGRSPRAASVAALAARGFDSMPSHGMFPVTVPGAVSAWCAALERFGSRTIGEAVAPAIAYAREGFPVSEIIAREWSLSAALLQNDAARRAFTIDGRPPRLGEIVRLPDLARTLDEIAAGGADAFYRGPIAEKIAACSRELGGWLDAEDLAAHESSWVKPISTSYREHEVYEIPPNGQGITALIGLNILECFDLAGLDPRSTPMQHLRIEAVKLAFADRNRWVADPDHSRLPIAELLSKDYAQGRAALVRADKALKGATPGRLRTGTDTVYLCAADGAGNVVSLINSLYFAFGSGVVADGTGVVLQNRGFGFVVDPKHPNCLAPRKRPLHTIIPAMLTRDGKPLVAFGVMGGDMQAQGHVQVVSNLVDCGLNIQEAIDQPRLHYLDADRVALEPGLAAAAPELARLGHAIEDPMAALARGGFGGGQGIMIDPATGALWGGSDSRKDGAAVGF